MYLFVTENRATRGKIDAAEFPALLRALLQDFSDPLLVKIRGSLDANSQIVYRPLEGLLQPLPWHLGSVVLIGDAVHATTPHLASGACIGLEDAIVLAEETARQATLDAALGAFERRRWERCRMVVENSARLGDIEIAGGDMQEHARIMRDSMISLASPI
jgi:2-polyprenyl-6-methoxyphenol hydroxylase-like FAD-dependent oxidoreductase